MKTKVRQSFTLEKSKIFTAEDAEKSDCSHPFAKGAKWWGSLSSQRQRRRTGVSAPHEQKIGLLKFGRLELAACAVANGQYPYGPFCLIHFVDNPIDVRLPAMEQIPQRSLAFSRF